MQNVFTKLIALSIALTVSTSAITPRNAEAAAVIGFAAQQDEDSGTVSTVAAIVFGTAWATGVSVAVYSLSLNGGALSGPLSSVFQWAAGIALLDADGSLPTSMLEKALGQEFPFIDNAEVVSNLAIQMKEQAKNTAIVDGKQIVRLDAATVKNILAPAFLSDAQVEQVAAKLQ